MNQKCHYCGNTAFETKPVEYIHQREGQYLIVKGVPCEVCLSCGERYYDATVLKKIEEDFEAIQNQGKIPKSAQHVPIEDYAAL